MAENFFDYIIAGGGMAGLSLAFYLNESRLRDKKVLIIDREAKDKNDHTWCFWEKSESAFEQIVFRKWKGFWFHGTNDFSAFLDLGDNGRNASVNERVNSITADTLVHTRVSAGYEYKMIRAADFYEFVLNKLKANPNFTRLQAGIEQIENAIVKTDKGEFIAKEFVFDSFTRKAYDNPKYQNLWQHFKGWLIETEKPFFNSDEPTLFDFRVEQKNECRFAYILPFSASEALIEFTVFSDKILEQNEYDFYLKKYIAEVLRIEKYKILETETGIIPMSDEPHEQTPASEIIRIGTSGGYVKPSTGYSFQRTQRRLKNLVGDLTENRKPKTENRNWKSYLDSVLLNVLLTKKHAADDVFTRLFSKNKTAQVLKFLDEDTSFAEDLAIMRTVPLAPFTKAAAAIFFKKAIK